MIANQSASISPIGAEALAEVRDLSLNCRDCQSPVAADDFFCQECGVTLGEKTPENRISKLVDNHRVEYVASARRSAVLLGVIATIVLAVFAVMAIAGSYDAMSEDYICDHARKLLAQNDALQAADIMQRFYLARGDKMKQPSRELLGLALMKRSELYTGRNQVDLAKKDLKDIPSNTSQSALASQKLLALEPPVVQAIKPEKVIKPVEVQSRTVVSKPAISNDQKTVEKAAHGATFSTGDVADYNRLLAAYFEKAGTENEQLSEAKPVTEPPTLKEWVSAGRPEF